jgi:HAD superfamily hydrolase (TIGR01509 family)
MCYHPTEGATVTEIPKRISAFIFDLDGVIVDSTEVHSEVWVEYLKPFGVNVAGIREQMHGRRNDEIVRALFGEGLSLSEVKAHGAAKEALYRKVMIPQLHSRLVPGVREFVARYAHLPLAVASNAEPANVSAILEAAGLRAWFRVVVDGHQVNRPKPHPEIYWKTSEMLGVPPDECLVFEDSKAGVAAAKAAGCRVIGLSTTCRELPGVELMVPHFQAAELTQWLEAELHRL